MVSGFVFSFFFRKKNEKNMKKHGITNGILIFFSFSHFFEISGDSRIFFFGDSRVGSKWGAKWGAMTGILLKMKGTS